MKRFYKIVSLGHAPGGHSIMLDGKPVKTPSRNLLTTNNQNIVNAILQEWAAQGEAILPDTMPLTQLLNTKIDRVATERAAMTPPLMKYLDTDLLCYRTNHPPALAQRQQDSWNPWLLWFEREFGCGLQTTEDLKALQQPKAAHAAVQEFIDQLDDEHFTVLQLVTPITGSIVLALAFVARALTPEEAFAAARVEENYKAKLYDEEKYGPDPAQEKKDKSICADLVAAAKFLDLLSN